MTTPAAAPSSLLDRIVAAPPVVRRRVLVDFIIDQLKEELGAGDEIHPRSRFEEMGIDSKRALEFKEFLEQEFQCSLRTTLLFDYPNPERLAGFIIDDVLRLGGGGGANAAAGTAPPSSPQPAAAPADDAGSAPEEDDADVEELMRRKLEKY
jgi:acyl carrier protein